MIQLNLLKNVINFFGKTIISNVSVKNVKNNKVISLINNILKLNLCLLHFYYILYIIEIIIKIRQIILVFLSLEHKY